MWIITSQFYGFWQGPKMASISSWTVIQFCGQFLSFNLGPRQHPRMHQDMRWDVQWSTDRADKSHYIGSKSSPTNPGRTEGVHSSFHHHLHSRVMHRYTPMIDFAERQAKPRGVDKAASNWTWYFTRWQKPALQIFLGWPPPENDIAVVPSINSTDFGIILRWLPPLSQLIICFVLFYQSRKKCLIWEPPTQHPTAQDDSALFGNDSFISINFSSQFPSCWPSTRTQIQQKKTTEEKKNGKIYLNKLLSSSARTPLTWPLIDHLRRRRRRPPDIMHVQFGSFAGFSGRSSPDVQPKVGSGGWTTVSVVSIKTPSDNREKVAGEWCKRTFFILIRFFLLLLCFVSSVTSHMYGLCVGRPEQSGMRNRGRFSCPAHYHHAVQYGDTRAKSSSSSGPSSSRPGSYCLVCFVCDKIFPDSPPPLLWWGPKEPPLNTHTQVGLRDEQRDMSRSRPSAAREHVLLSICIIYLPTCLALFQPWANGAPGSKRDKVKLQHQPRVQWCGRGRGLYRHPHFVTLDHLHRMVLTVGVVVVVVGLGRGGEDHIIFRTHPSTERTDFSSVARETCLLQVDHVSCQVGLWPGFGTLRKKELS